MVKRIISEYGDFIRDTAIVTALFLLIFRFLPAGNGTYGIGNVLGHKVEAESSGLGYSSYVDTTAIAEILTREKPVIEFHPYNAAGQKTPLEAAKDVALTGYFYSTDADGIAVTNIQICSIKDQSGIELLSGRLLQTDTFRFSTAGVYQIEVIATDGKNLYSKMQFSVPVSNSTKE